MTVKTRIHDMIDVVATIRAKTASDVAFTVRTEGNSFSFEIETSGGHERFSDLESAESWLSTTVLSIGNESDPEIAKELQEKGQEKVRMENLIAVFQARIAAL